MSGKKKKELLRFFCMTTEKRELVVYQSDSKHVREAMATVLNPKESLVGEVMCGPAPPTVLIADFSPAYFQRPAKKEDKLIPVSANGKSANTSIQAEPTNTSIQPEEEKK
jgi:hypothetical protein